MFPLTYRFFGRYHGLPRMHFVRCQVAEVENLELSRDYGDLETQVTTGGCLVLYVA